MHKKIKICLISEYAYSLLIGTGRRVGGGEVQMVLLAKELAKRQYDVSFITFHKKSRLPEIIEDIKIYNPFDNKASSYMYLYPQNVYYFLKILKTIDADIYIQKAKTPLTGAIYLYSKLRNKSFIYLASSDDNVSRNLIIKGFKNFKNVFFKLGVKYCDYVVCQTDRQKELLYSSINKIGRVIKNIYIIDQKKYDRNNEDNLKVLWVGRLLKSKKPELFLQLAKNIPDFNFWIIGSPSDEEPVYYHKIKEESKKINNLEFIGFVPHNEIQRYYKKSSLLVNTSANEGFPNTFLEAWGNAIPVVSLGFDPDEIICKHKLGFHSINFNDLVKDTYTLLKNKSLRESMGLEAKNYVLREHNVDNIMDKYEEIFNEILKTKKDKLYG
jgi:glycosyltransferase involved in cell wall biosynthesis